MTQPFESEPEDPSHTQSWPADVPLADEVEPVSPRRFYPVAFFLALAAWGLVVVLVAAAVIRTSLDAAEAAEPTSPDRDIHIYVFRTQARYIVGTHEWFKGQPGANKEQMFEQAKSLFAGTVNQRLRFIPLAGELAGPETALHYLRLLDYRVQKNGVSYTPEQRLQRDILHKLYQDYAKLRYDAPSVPETERLQLREQLGWFGDLALAPPGQPGAATNIVAVAGVAAPAEVREECTNPLLRQDLVQSAMALAVVVWVLVFGGLMLAFVGFVALIAFAILGFVGMLRRGVTTGQSPAGVYIETFALWMASFAVLSLGLPYLTQYVELGDFRLMASGVIELATLLVVFWPVLRGVSWKQVRQDIGWTRGRQPVLEPAAGIGCYVMSLPLLIVAILVVALLTWLQTQVQQQFFGGGPSPDDFTSPMEPNHPITMPLARGDWSIRLQIFFLASFVAPIVEETMFRGVLYRHLRELTKGWATAMSVFVSAIVSSFIFAVIHPQGFLAVPVLMALALGFVLAREWRGTLVGAMIAHGLNNGFVLLISVVTLSG
jgi:membrane protease YdiL (CAAX protease family)